MFLVFLNSIITEKMEGYAVAQLVEGTVLKAGRPRVLFPDGVIDIILPTALWPLGLTQTLTEMSTRNLFCGGV